ncbi:MAG TPA: hypothetical protein VE999_08425 [Gemmataceae bacterium]|jgi:hypothetical protein|nr:hypothetical protein [Gemmataceae bacterium]
MSINPVFGNTELQPEDLNRLELAYKYALRSLSLVDRNDPLTRIVAEKIVEVGASERDPWKISEIVVKQLGVG